MSKNNNVQNFYGNREQRRQQERYARKQKNVYDDITIKKVNGLARVDIQENSELPCEVGYGDHWYRINTGYLTLVNIARLDEERNKKVAAGKFSGMEAITYFDNILRVVFEDGEYERFFKENPNTSFEGVRELANAMTKLISSDKSGLIDDSEDANAKDSFRN